MMFFRVFRVSEDWFSVFFRVLMWFSEVFQGLYCFSGSLLPIAGENFCDFWLLQTHNLPSLLLCTSCPPQANFFWKVSTLLEIYFGGDKCRNLSDFGLNAPKFFSTEYLSLPNIYLCRIFNSAEYLSPPNICLRRTFSKSYRFWRKKRYNSTERSENK